MKMYGMREVSNITGRPLTTIWRWARTGVLPAKKFGKVYLISESDLQTFLENGTK